ncbi:MAG: hypothetical protein IPP69_12155 [Flavobacteriales bacterium]|jgi:hypothetical protein|nr:hypothetical protein [Flavobacteriales bacterium]
MKRRNSMIAFGISLIATIGIWMAIKGKPDYRHRCGENCHQQEMTTEAPAVQ